MDSEHQQNGYGRSRDYRGGDWRDYPPVVLDADTGEVLNPAPNPHGIKFASEGVTFSWTENEEAR